MDEEKKQIKENQEDKPKSDSTKTAHDFIEVSEQANKTLREVAGALSNTVFSNALSEFAKFSKIIASYNYSIITDSLSCISDSIANILKSIKIPELTESRKQELINSYKEWSKYGWSVNPEADFLMMNTVPENRKIADKMALSYCKKENLERVFSTTRKDKRAKIKDYDEAVSSFRGKKYKSCAMILFSLVDAQLIRMQKKSDLRNQHRKRAVGSKAINEAKKRLEEYLNGKNWITIFTLSNLFDCLAKMFEYGDDFKKQPMVINRNFLSHGMMTRDVTRKDCIQLFLLYYNTLHLLEIVYQKEKHNG